MGCTETQGTSLSGPVAACCSQIVLVAIHLLLGTANLLPARCSVHCDTMGISESKNKRVMGATFVFPGLGPSTQLASS